MQHHFIGIEIGGTKLQLVCADDSLAIQEQISLEVKKESGAKGIQQQIEEAIAKLKSNKKIAAIGVGFGGPVNYKTGKISVSHQVSGWDDFDLKNWLQQLTGSPVYIDNDANVAALGEAVHGAGAAFQIVFYMTIGSGIGGGMIVNKTIYHGAFPGEAEIGHVRLNKQGDTLESLCSGWAVDKKIREAIMNNPNSELAKLAGSTEKGEARFLNEALKKDDAAAKKIIEETEDNIAFVLSHVVHLFHPEIIIIGGGLSLLGEHFRSAIASQLPSYVMKAFHPVPAIKIAILEKNVVPIGALELAKSSFRKNN